MSFDRERLRAMAQNTRNRLDVFAWRFTRPLETIIPLMPMVPRWLNPLIGVFTLVYSCKYVFAPHAQSWLQAKFWLFTIYYTYAKYLWFAVFVFAYGDNIYSFLRLYSKPCYHEFSAHYELYLLVAGVVFVWEMSSEGAMLRSVLWVPGYIIYWHFPFVWRPIFDLSGPRASWNRLFFPLKITGMQWVALWLSLTVLGWIKARLPRHYAFLALWAGMWAVIEAWMRGGGLPWPEMHSEAVVGVYGQCYSVFAVLYRAYLIWLRWTPYLFIGTQLLYLFLDGVLMNWQYIRQSGLKQRLRRWKGKVWRWFGGDSDDDSSESNSDCDSEGILSCAEIQYLKERGIGKESRWLLANSGLQSRRLRSLVRNRRQARLTQLMVDGILSEYEIRTFEEDPNGVMRRLGREERLRVLEAMRYSDEEDGDDDEGEEDEEEEVGDGAAVGYDTPTRVNPSDPGAWITGEGFEAELVARTPEYSDVPFKPGEKINKGPSPGGSKLNLLAGIESAFTSNLKPAPKPNPWASKRKPLTGNKPALTSNLKSVPEPKWPLGQGKTLSGGGGGTGFWDYFPNLRRAKTPSTPPSPSLSPSPSSLSPMIGPTPHERHRDAAERFRQGFPMARLPVRSRLQIWGKELSRNPGFKRRYAYATEADDSRESPTEAIPPLTPLYPLKRFPATGYYEGEGAWLDNVWQEDQRRIKRGGWVLEWPPSDSERQRWEQESLPDNDISDVDDLGDSDLELYLPPEGELDIEFEDSDDEDWGPRLGAPKVTLKRDGEGEDNGKKTKEKGVGKSKGTLKSTTPEPKILKRTPKSKGKEPARVTEMNPTIQKPKETPKPTSTKRKELVRVIESKPRIPKGTLEPTIPKEKPKPQRTEPGRVADTKTTKPRRKNPRKVKEPKVDTAGAGAHEPSTKKKEAKKSTTKINPIVKKVTKCYEKVEGEVEGDEEEVILAFTSRAVRGVISSAARMLSPILLQEVTIGEEMVLVSRLPRAPPPSPEQALWSSLMPSTLQCRIFDLEYPPSSPYSVADTEEKFGRGERYMSPEEIVEGEWEPVYVPPPPRVRRDPADELRRKWYLAGFALCVFWYLAGNAYKESKDYIHVPVPRLSPWEDVLQASDNEDLRWWEMPSVAYRVIEEEVAG